MSAPMERYKMEADEGWRETIKSVPELGPFPAGWMIKVIPPFGGAVARFTVRLGKASVSVYLDTMDRLGYYGAPYWEVYPYDGDVGRCDMADADELLRMIKQSISDQLLAREVEGGAR